ncbi:acyltransferase domain-containing protein, partial [Nocardia abscessus]|uniref:acyltransferase domain-containing protein n=1 Tax=Nocardia abscessus TaxID=120957 RepID=UPI00245725EB
MPWVVSGKSEAALRDQARRLAQWVQETGELDPVEVGRSLIAHRSVFDHRAVVFGEDTAGLCTALTTLADGGQGANLVQGRSRGPGEVIFVFPGQGSQWIGMGQDLFRVFPVFADSISDCDRELSRFVDWSLLDVLSGVTGSVELERIDVVQPVLFSVMVALAALWRSFGVHPSGVVGHSQGEIAAAYVCGALSLSDAVKIVALRSRALTTLDGGGAMVSIPLPVDTAETRLQGRDRSLSIAAVNGPDSVVVSGEPTAVEQLSAALVAEGIRARQIAVGYASHSPQVEPLREDLIGALTDITPRTADIPFYSTVTGAVFDTAGLDAEYWYRNLRQTVRFEPVIAQLEGPFIEVSPHPVLMVGIQETLDRRTNPDILVGSIRRDGDGVRHLISGLSELFVRGVGVDWPVLLGAGSGLIDLPTYAFQRQRFWLESAGTHT